MFIFHKVSLFWSIFYIADDVQAVLHDVQDKTQHDVCMMYYRIYMIFYRITRMIYRMSMRSTGRLHDVYTVYTPYYRVYNVYKQKMEIDKKQHV